MDNLYENTNWDDSIPMRPGGIELTEKLVDISGIKRGVFLDFGCGEGHTSNYLINKNFDVIGTDKSEVLIKKAMTRYPDVKFIISEDIDILKFQNKFDGVISECVISTFSNVKEVISKVHSLLKYNGVFIINDIMALIKKESNNFFTFNEWIEVLNTSGFKIIYFEDNTLELKKFYLKNLWEKQTNCMVGCIPKGYKASEIGYFSIIAKKI